MGFYDALDPKEVGQEFRHVVFEELTIIFAKQSKLLPISAEDNERRVNEIQYLPIKLVQEEIKGLKQEDL